MNFKRNEKYASAAFYVFITVCACALVILGLLNIEKVMMFLKKITSKTKSKMRTSSMRKKRKSPKTSNQSIQNGAVSRKQNRAKI